MEKFSIEHGLLLLLSMPGLGYMCDENRSLRYDGISVSYLVEHPFSSFCLNRDHFDRDVHPLG